MEAASTMLLLLGELTTPTRTEPVVQINPTSSQVVAVTTATSSNEFIPQTNVTPPIGDNVNLERSMSPYPIASLDLNHIGSPDNGIMVRSINAALLKEKEFANSHGIETLPRQASDSSIRSVPRAPHKTTDINFAQSCLARHNEYRAKHRVEPLKLSSELSAFAQNWANHLANIRTMVHRQNNKYGENLYMYRTTDRSHRVQGGDAVDSWYKGELKYYTFGTEPRDLKAGHLTQVLWAGSKYMGVGVAKNGEYTFVVCNYNPPGNYKGKYAANVPPIGGWKNNKRAITTVLEARSVSSAQTQEAFANTLPRQASDSSIRSVPRAPQKTTDINFAQSCLARHNEYRAKHRVEPLKLSSELSAFAQNWANHLANIRTMVHRQNNKYGENLYMYRTTDRSHRVQGGDAVDSWYKGELKYYTFGTEPRDLKAGHLTQVLWAGSKYMGVGVAKNGEYTFVVCNYNPPGNYKGKYAANVPPIGGWKNNKRAITTVLEARSVSSAQTQEAFANTLPRQASDSSIRSVPRAPQKTTDINFAQSCLARHNEYRAKHRVEPLKLSSELSAFAQNWANHLANIRTMVHRQNNKYGENLYMYRTTDRSHRVQGGDAVDSWYKGELKYYTFGTEPRDLKAGHLTQVLWAGSKYMGVGVAKNGEYTFVVCNYNPPGNYKGKYAANVPPIGGWKNNKRVITTVSEARSVSSAQTQEAFAKDTLRIHNEYRAKHGAAPLSLDPNIGKYAQAWANHLAEKNIFSHRTNSPYGENLFWSSGSASAKAMCDSWYSEETGYNYKVDPFTTGGTGLKSGHFTQMVWKESKSLGVGRAFSKNGAMIAVTNYSPRGNMIGRFTANVFPPKWR